MKIRVENVEPHKTGVAGGKHFLVKTRVRFAVRNVHSGQRLKTSQRFLQLGDPWFHGVSFPAPARGLGRFDRTVAILDSGKTGLDRVEVTLRNRIEFVIVTARTADAQAKQRLPHASDDFAEGILPGEPFRYIVGTDLSRQQ